MDVVTPDADLLVVTEHGYGKRTPLSEYRLQSRGGKGIKTLSLTSKNGRVVGVKVVQPGNEVLLITQAGIIIRMRVGDISVMSRATQGVRIMKLDEGDALISLGLIRGDEEED